MLILQKPADLPAAAGTALRELHGCTPSETRLALLLAQGQTLKDASRALGIGYESARVVLKRVFLKLDVHTQAQLVSKVLGLTPSSLAIRA